MRCFFSASADCCCLLACCAAFRLLGDDGECRNIRFAAVEMEKAAETNILGSRHAHLKKSFRRTCDFLLTAFPFEDFSKAFPTFTEVEREQLYQLYVQVIISLHDHLKNNFNSLCHDTQVGTTLDAVEDLVQHLSLDPLYSKKSNLVQVKHELLAKKEAEVHLLEGLIDKVEDQKHNLKARIKLLKKKGEDISCHSETVEKLTSMLATYGSYNDEGV